MATYLTDSWSTISGLAAVAYGSPDRYPEVANQVRGKSVTAFLGPTPPSEIISTRITVDSFLSAVQKEYDKGGEFTDHVDSQGDTVNNIASNMYSLVTQAYNEFSTYESSLTDAIEYVSSGLNIPIDSQSLKDELTRAVPDLELFSSMASSITYNKLDKLPSGVKISLDDSVSLEKDHNGISFLTGYLTPNQYFDDIAYPGMGFNGNNLPGTIIDSLVQGYLGYPTTQPLDDLLRPGIASLVSSDDISDLRGISRSIAGLGSINTLKDLSGYGAMSAADQFMYNVDLSELVVGINGYTTYVPSRDSNGRYLDQSLLPDYDESNADSGLPTSQRPRSAPFNS